MTPRTAGPASESGRHRCGHCGAETGDGVFLCRRDALRLARALERLAGWLIGELEVTRTGQDRTGSSSGRSGSPLHEQGLNLRTDVRTVVGGLASVLDRWAAYAWTIDADNATNSVPPWWNHAPETVHRLVAQARYLRGAVGRLRVAQRAAEACEEITGIAARATRIVDAPRTSSRFEVGPCPETIEHGTPTTAAVTCTGTVHATIGATEDRPSVMRCDAPECGRKWGTSEWLRAGRRIAARREQLDRQARRATA